MRKPTSFLVGIVFVLLLLGIVMLASTSGVRAESSLGDSAYYVKRQFAWMTLGVIAAVAVSSFNYHWWERLAVPLILVSVVLLVAVLVPGIGTRVSGSSRWIRAGPFSFQPSELAKLAIVVVLAAWMVHAGWRVTRLREGLVYPLLIVGVVAALILKEPDYGTTVLIGCVSMLIMFMGGTQMVYLLITGLMGGCGMALMVMSNPVRMRRIMAFLDPASNPEAAFQVIQSKYAFILGGPFGVGLGNSSQKHSYLPEAHTDFILPIIGEELGLVTLLIVALFIGILVCGTIISLRAADLFGRLLGLGLTVMLTLQAAINVGVVTGCLPTKGLPLPFISYGGTSLVMSLVAVGVLISIARGSAVHADERSSNIIKDRAHVV